MLMDQWSDLSWPKENNVLFLGPVRSDPVWNYFQFLVGVLRMIIRKTHMEKLVLLKYLKI